MKQLAELVPVAVFFAVYALSGKTLALAGWTYHFDGIYSATVALMIATSVQVVLTRLVTGQLEKRLLLLLAVVLAFGSATLLLHDPLFIQWKPTIFNWALAAGFAGTQLWTDKTVMERALAGQLSLPGIVWRRLNLLWIANFVLVGALNLVVVYNFSESVWVSYKLFSMIGFTLLLSGLTVLLIMPHIKEDGATPPAGGRGAA